MLGVDPIALRIGTVMPGMLGLIEVGSASELGRAVSELTGLSSLADLAAHAKRVKTRIDKELVKAKVTEKTKAEASFNAARDDLNKEIKAHQGMAPAVIVPPCSDDPGIEEVLRAATEHFETIKSTAFEAAKEILGQAFDPADIALRDDLERNIGGRWSMWAHRRSCPQSRGSPSFAAFRRTNSKRRKIWSRGSCLKGGGWKVWRKIPPPQGERASTRASRLGSKSILIRTEAMISA